MKLQAPQARIAALPAQLRQAEVAAWIVLSTDPHQREYVAEHWQERALLSGFSGSTGTLHFTRPPSHFDGYSFTDGRPI